MVRCWQRTLLASHDSASARSAVDWMRSTYAWAVYTTLSSHDTCSNVQAMEERAGRCSQPCQWKSMCHVGCHCRADKQQEGVSRAGLPAAQQAGQEHEHQASISPSQKQDGLKKVDGTSSWSTILPGPRTSSWPPILPGPRIEQVNDNMHADWTGGQTAGTTPQLLHCSRMLLSAAMPNEHTLPASCMPLWPCNNQLFRCTQCGYAPALKYRTPPCGALHGLLCRPNTACGSCCGQHA